MSTTTQPARRVGILGGGQLGMMLARAGAPLGLEFQFWDPATEIPAAGLGQHFQAPWDDVETRARFTAGLDVITFEFENVSRQSVRALDALVPVRPGPEALRLAGDRLFEKTLFNQLGIPVPPFRAVIFRDEFDGAIAELGLPLVAKTRRLGYDGKGQAVLRTADDVEAAWQALGGQPLLLEALVPFDREVSLIGARFATGETVFYPLVENHHAGGILRLTRAPAPRIDPAMQRTAEAMMGRLLDAMGYVGVLAMEFFLCGNQLMANEMAPRVHNTGHWSIEGAETSQFENHLRAVAGMAPGSTAIKGFAAMINIIGDDTAARALPHRPGVTVHLYGKTPRPGRKLGHITVVAEDEATRDAMVEGLQAALGG